MSNESHTAVISGSFKFKPEIDALHEQFADYDVAVLAPEIGWLWLPNLVMVEEFRPLPAERGMSLRQVEDSFLAKIRIADFLYIYNAEGYIGESTGLEIGFALGCDKPIYSHEVVDYLKLADGNLSLAPVLRAKIKHMTIEEIIEKQQIIKDNLLIDETKAGII